MNAITRPELTRRERELRDDLVRDCRDLRAEADDLASDLIGRIKDANDALLARETFSKVSALLRQAVTP